MQFEWDDSKRKLNWAQHRVDFAYVALIFQSEHLTRIDDREKLRRREIDLSWIDRWRVFRGRVYRAIRRHPNYFGEKGRQA